MTEVEILKPKDAFGAFIFEVCAGSKDAESIKIGIPGTELVAGAEDRIGAVFELFELLKEMNENMKNIDEGINRMNENLENMGLGGLENDERQRTY